MFKKDLLARLEGIFDFEKVTYDAVSESYEQDTLFIEVWQCIARLSSFGRQRAQVRGSLAVFSQANRLPFGYFNKRIERAKPALLRGLYFHNIDIDVASSPARLQNLHERRTDFVFFYDAQYDPERGQLTELDTTVSFGE